MAQQEKQKVKLTISQVLDDLSDGLDRKQIRQKYNLTATDVTNLFQHPKLKGKRVKPAPGFELEDDTAEEAKEEPKRAISKKVTGKDKVAEAAAPVIAAAQEETKEDGKSEVAEDVNTEKAAETSEGGEKVETKKGLW